MTPYSYLHQAFPGIAYDVNRDVYEYRGYEFKSHKFSDNSYCLVDVDNKRLRVMPHGLLEDRWQEYLNAKEKNEFYIEIPQKPFIDRFYEWLKKNHILGC